MNSMTGFGRSEVKSASGTLFQAEIFSVNRKQLEIKPLLPKEASGLEPIVRKFISSRISRGCITVKVSVSFPEKILRGTIKVNDSIVDDYMARIARLQDRHSIRGGIDIAAILSLPGAITEQEDISLPEEDIGALEKALDGAFRKLDKMRGAEGTELGRDIEKRLSRLEKNLARIESLAADLPARQKELFLKRLSDSGLSVSTDDERVLKEIAIFCDRFDTSEEITRLKSHFLQFRKFLQSSEPTGRSLDFLIQEMLREINTLGNKTPLVEVTFIIVDFKTELEKIREQVQNIE